MSLKSLNPNFSLSNLRLASGNDEKARKQDKLDEYLPVCSKITENIFISGETASKNMEALVENNIRYILNCAGAVCTNDYPEKFEYRTLFVNDGRNEDYECYFLDLIDYIHSILEQKQNILIHCHQGVSRSSTLVIMYLMWKNNQTFDETLQFVRSIRPICAPNSGFVCQLLMWYKRFNQLLSLPLLYQITSTSSNEIVLKSVPLDNNNNNNNNNINNSDSVQRDNNSSNSDDNSNDHLNSKTEYNLNFNSNNIYILQTEDCLNVYLGPSSLPQYRNQVDNYTRRINYFLKGPNHTRIIEAQSSTSMTTTEFNNFNINIFWN